MTTLAVLALLCCAGLAGASIYLTRETAELRRRAASLESEVAEFAAEPVQVPLSEIAATRDRRLITVEILNPLQLAANESRAAGAFGRVAPTTVTRIVYEQAAKQILAELANQGVEAQVRVRSA